MSKRNNSNKRVDSTIEYIDDLSDEFSKLNIVRVDLSYKKPYSDTMSLEDVNKDLDRMANNMRSKPTIFKHKIGHVLKREYTEDKGVHLHAMFIFEGQKVKSDTYKADEIGKYWEKQQKIKEVTTTVIVISMIKKVLVCWIIKTAKNERYWMKLLYLIYVRMSKI